MNTPLARNETATLMRRTLAKMFRKIAAGNPPPVTDPSSAMAGCMAICVAARVITEAQMLVLLAHADRITLCNKLKRIGLL